jgi:hypothetical protein
MKRLIFAVCLVLAACGSEDNAGSPDEATTETLVPTATSTNTEVSRFQPTTSAGTATATATSTAKAQSTTTEVKTATVSTSTSATTATQPSSTVTYSGSSTSTSTGTVSSIVSETSEGPQVDLAEVRRVRTALFSLAAGSTWDSLSEDVRTLLSSGDCEESQFGLGPTCVVRLWRGGKGLDAWWYYFSFTFDQIGGTVTSTYSSYNHYDGYSTPDVPVYKDLVTRDQVVAVTLLEEFKKLRHGDVVVDSKFLSGMTETTVDPPKMFCTPENRYFRRRSFSHVTSTAEIWGTVYSLHGKIVQGVAWAALNEQEAENNSYKFYYLNVTPHPTTALLYTIPVLPDGCELANPTEDGWVFGHPD